MKVWLKDFFGYKTNLGEGTPVRELPTVFTQLVTNDNVIAVDCFGSIHVKDLTELAEQFGPPFDGVVVRFKDPKTGIHYELRRVSND